MIPSRSLPPIPAAIWQKPSYFVAFGFGTGALPIAPGTFGTLIAIPFYLLLQPLPFYAYLTIVLLCAIVSMKLCDILSKEIHVHDHPGMNIDEIIGFLVTMIHAPPHWLWIIVGFALFRLFDIWKPWPIHWLDQKVPGGIGMVLDDILAGIYGLVIIQALAWSITTAVP
ncbi:MAG: phosphatidylglycerophosphatase [Gammaproteobacteria bacterium RIFCSPHIGHO2_12_FULL_41_20]|nr:MAG: phosphatidylglycerophosphatase [Gammaproteobacteria bacterium RIFCSPHIGHO2_12_FULL_41_20]